MEVLTMDITVNLQKSKKVYEEKSLFVSFPYSKEHVDKIKSLDTRFYTPDTKAWEVPVATFKELKTLFSDDKVICENFKEKDLDKYLLKDKNDTTHEPLKVEDIKLSDFKLVPYQYQLEGIKYGIDKHKFILGDEQGLGKTKQVLDLARLRKDEIKRCLILCGVNGLKYNWLKEVEKHTDEKAVILGSRINRNGKLVEGNLKERINHLENLGDEFFLITNIETLRNDEFRDELARQIRFKNIGMVAIDEAHMVKNVKTAQGRNIHWIKPKYQIAVTGTPLINKPDDLYNMLKWLGQEDGNLYQFRDRYCYFDSWGNIIGYKNKDELAQRLDKIMIRRKKGDVLDLPPKINSEVFVELEKEQNKQYEEVKKGLLSLLDEKGKNASKNLKYVVQQIHYFRQIATFLAGEPEHAKKNPKFIRTKELVDEAIENGGKIIIYSNWKEVVHLIHKEMSAYNPLSITGDTPITERQALVDKFQNDDACKVIAGTVDALGTGFTLTAASTVIFLDNPWTMARKVQAEDRAHRIGTNGTAVNIITLLSKNTIDERIQELIEDKGELAADIVDGEIMSDPVKKMDKEMVKWLLS